MMRKFTQLLALCALMLPLVAQAQEPIERPNYWGIAYSAGEYDQKTDPSVKLDQRGFRLKFGRFFSRYFAVEGHLGTYGKDDTDVEGLANDVGLQTDILVSAFARANIPFARERAHFYGLLGATFVSADSDDENIVVLDGEEAGLAFGVGLELFGDERNGVELSWIRYMHETEVDDIEFNMDMWNLGYIRRF